MQIEQHTQTTNGSKHKLKVNFEKYLEMNENENTKYQNMRCNESSESQEGSL